MIKVLLAVLSIVSGTALRAQADPLADVVRSLAFTNGQVDLAVHLETEGHWAFANRAGERFTAAGPIELERAVAALAPRAERADQTLVLHLSEPTVFSGAKALASLPQNARLRGLIEGKTYALERRIDLPILVQIAPGVAMVAGNRGPFLDGLWQLQRPLPRAHIRVVAFEPGAPAVMSSSPRFDPVTKKALIDQVDPAAMTQAFAGARAQVIVVTGRFDGTNLITQASGHAERPVGLAEIEAAAAGIDATLVVLQTGSAQQPGGRNILWRPVTVPGLDTGRDVPTLADVLALSAGKRPLIIEAEAQSSRVHLNVRVVTGAGGAFTVSRWTQVLSEVTADLLGKAPARVITVSVPAVSRQQELDRRVIKAIPAHLQFAYAGLLLLGLCGAPTAWRWFARVWPHEHAADYANAAGYHAARAVRATLFAVVFMPLAAIVAAPAQLVKLVRPSI